MAKQKIDEKFVKAMHSFCSTFWKQEMDEAHKLFTLKQPDVEGYYLRNKAVEAWLSWAQKRDNARRSKLALIKSMAGMMNNHYDVDKEEKANAKKDLDNLIILAEKRAVNGN